MKITVDISSLTPEQVKCLSQLGWFMGDETWESHCEPEDFEEVHDLLMRAGLPNWF